VFAAGSCLHQDEAFRHITVPSMILEMPSLNFSGSTISRAATASTVDSAFCRNNIAASFFSVPGLLPAFAASATSKAPFAPSVTFRSPAATDAPLAVTNPGQVMIRTPWAGVPSAV